MNTRQSRRKAPKAAVYRSTAKEMEKLDEVAVAHGLAIHQMMELAGFHMVELFKILRVKKTARIVALCGSGNKGGDGLSAARHLINHGYTDVSVVLTKKSLKPDPRHHLALLVKMKVPIMTFGDVASARKIAKADVIIDAIVGYHLRGMLRGGAFDAVNALNASSARVIAYDMPTGLDATSGVCRGVCATATATLTLALPKRGLFSKEGKRKSGRVFLADIGIPAFLYDMVKRGSRPAFGGGIIRLP